MVRRVSALVSCFLLLMPHLSWAAAAMAPRVRAELVIHDDLRQVLRGMQPDGREKLLQLIRKNPEAWLKTIDGMKSRGWKPTSSVSVAKSQSAGIRKASLQSQYQSGGWLLLIWDWSDGNPGTLEATYYVEDLYWNDSITFGYQFYDDGTTAYDSIHGLWAEMYNYDGGNRYNPDGSPRQREARLGQGGIFCRRARAQCLGAAIKDSADKAMKNTKWATGLGSIACGLLSETVVAYLLCMGVVAANVADNFSNAMSEWNCPTCGG